MKPGLTVGMQAEVRDLVTEAMRPQFDGVVVHDVYSTAAMVHHVEHAARKILLPYLEEHEEGMGASVSVTHKAPTMVGKEIRAVATLTEFTDRKLVTEVQVWNDKLLVGEGVVIQAVMPKEFITRRIREMNEA